MNGEYGNVYYRGVNGLFDNVLPSLPRKRSLSHPKDLSSLMNTLFEDENTKCTLKFLEYEPGHHKIPINRKIRRFNRYIIESLMQHYVGFTRFLDVVDNHWVALWMGLQDFVMHGNDSEYCYCKERIMPLGDVFESYVNSRIVPDKDIYEYILLMAMPYATETPKRGIVETDEFVEVDLRKALPSIFIRPHAQHALVIKRREKQNPNSDAKFYDMSSQVVAILRIRVDRAKEWLGNGKLLTKENIFPSPSVDAGYDTLLTKYSHIFKGPYHIVKYY